MTTWGLGVLLAGGIWLLVAYNMSTSIVIDHKSVTNVFMIAAREKHINIGWLMSVLGGVFTFLGIAKSSYLKKQGK